MLHLLSPQEDTGQGQPSDNVCALSQFNANTHSTAQEGVCVGPQGQWTRQNIANKDKTPLPFPSSEGLTYADTGVTSVCILGGSSGLEKRQCTAQLTVFVFQMM